MRKEMEKTINKSHQNENDETKRCNKEQREILVEFLQLHPELKSGKFSSTFTKKISRYLWTDVSKLLNSVPCGAIKNADQWKRCWSDMKRNTKSKASRIKQHKRVTGGGPKTKEELNDTQIRIAEILGDTAIEGHKAVGESDVNFLFDEEEQNSSEHALRFETDSSDDDSIGNDTQNIHDVNDVDMVSTTAPTLPSTSTASLVVPRTFARPSTGTTVTPSLPRGPRDKTPKLFSTKRLENTVEASKKLFAIGETKIEMKSSYYAKKISIMERQAIAKEEKVAVLKELNNNLQLIANAILLRDLNT